MILVEIFGFVGRHSSRSTLMTLFFSPNPLFTMERLAHIFAGACKAGVKSIKSDDDKVDTVLTRRNMQKCITWTKKSQKGARDLR